jgi:hypothetical protein
VLDDLFVIHFENLIPILEFFRALIGPAVLSHELKILLKCVLGQIISRQVGVLLITDFQTDSKAQKGCNDYKLFLHVAFLSAVYELLLLYRNDKMFFS